MAAEDVDTTRTAVKTYVPAYQKAEWEAHADALGMSQSEFVRTMVQAGRRGFLDELDTSEVETAASTTETESEPTAETETMAETSASDGSETREEGVELVDRAFRVIRTEGPVDWEDLHAELVGDLEAELDRSLRELQSENRIQYSGRNGGYVALAGENER